ncbi:hypothetical protein [Kitasatospora sp. MAP5-34]|uniref:hypothetical protein n=1 Tax=Kitasatospora sp. MAP5-34 TaxID=3035102 RepID=UPI002475B878|nr:hypothetical protein [Kitasatospora sp. MAP5-34]MDH6574840.1 hypothetical protein [Kitasatospora sp. MAP5-34]
MTRTEHKAPYTAPYTAPHAAQYGPQGGPQHAARRAPHDSACHPTELTAEVAAAGTALLRPWSIRTAPHRNGRAALEVYEHDELLDVMVTSVLSNALLRGARRSVEGGRQTGFAWGRLPADRTLPTVMFTGRRLSRRRQPARVVTLGGEFWLAWAEGPCGGVMVRHGGGSPVRLRTGRA